MNATATGYNPIRYDCSQYGCYLTECQPKTEMFSDCFPGKISFSDMDRIVERNGRALIIEWKGPGGEIKRSQEIMWGKLTRGTMITTIAVNGDSKTMEVSAYRICWDGEWRNWQQSDFGELKLRITSWANWAETNPVFSVAVNGLQGAK